MHKVTTGAVVSLIRGEEWSGSSAGAVAVPVEGPGGSGVRTIVGEPGIGVVVGYRPNVDAFCFECSDHAQCDTVHGFHVEKLLEEVRGWLGIGPICGV